MVPRSRAEVDPPGDEPSASGSFLPVLRAGDPDPEAVRVPDPAEERPVSAGPFGLRRAEPFEDPESASDSTRERADFALEP